MIKRPSLRSVVLILISVVSFGTGVFAQGEEDAVVKLADEMYNFGDVKDALEVYLQAVEINENNVRANYMVGRCYLETIDKEKSVDYLLTAYRLKPDVSKDIVYDIARGYHLGYNLDEAKNYYTDFVAKNQNSKDPQIKELVERAKRKIDECDNAKNFMSQELPVRMVNLGSSVNSSYPEYAPVISADESLLIFTSRRQGSTGKKKDIDNEFFEDIYISSKVGDTWSPAKNMGADINTETHDGSIGLSPDGKQLFIYKPDNGGDIYYSTRQNDGKWSKPKSLGNKINSKHYEPSVTISGDSKKLVFSSNRPGGKGGLDLYISYADDKGRWGTPENLGDIINTNLNEDSPFLDAEGTTLYFSSVGHNSMGGYDIFKSVYDENTKKWSSPENLGYPINSTDDDINFSVSGDSKHGYYASVKKGGIGEKDIYMIDLDVTEYEPEEPVEVAVLKKPDTLEQIAEKVEPIVVKKELLPVTAAKDPEVAKTPKEPAKIEKPVVKEVSNRNKFSDRSLEVGSKVILQNIYFDFDKVTLKEESYTELNELKKLLIERPNLIVEIGGHTDMIGSKEYNKELSRKRAQSVVNYLVSQGIGYKRFVAKGYGEEKPLASNDDEEDGRELNRRTEFIVLKK